MSKLFRILLIKITSFDFVKNIVYSMMSSMLFVASFHYWESFKKTRTCTNQIRRSFRNLFNYSSLNKSRHISNYIAYSSRIIRRNSYIIRNFELNKRLCDNSFIKKMQMKQLKTDQVFIFVANKINFLFWKLRVVY